MKSLIAIALFVLPVAAHAATPIGTRIEPVRAQVMQVAKANGYLGKGSGQTLRVSKLESNGQVTVTVMVKGGLPGMKPSLQPYARAQFKLATEVDGAVATPVKSDGRVFQRLFLMR